MVGWTILTNNTTPVQCEDYRQMFQADIVDHLVVGALEESGIDGHHRSKSFYCQSCSKGDTMLLSDSDVEKALRMGVQHPSFIPYLLVPALDK